MTHRGIVTAALCVALWATGAAGQNTGSKSTDTAPPARTFKEAVEKTRPNTATRPLPATEIAVLHLILQADRGKLREATLERILVLNAAPPKVFARSRGSWEVQLLGRQPARYRIQNPLDDVEVENPGDARSPFSKVAVEGTLPVDLVVPLSRDGKSLGVERIRIVDTESKRTVIDTPVRRQ